MTSTYTLREPRRQYEELLRRYPELRQDECEQCAGDLDRGVVHPLWIAALLGCMAERRHVRTGSDDAYSAVRGRFLRVFGKHLVASEALAMEPGTDEDLVTELRDG